MDNKVFVIYGGHGTGKQVESAISKIYEVVTENKLTFPNLISIIERGIDVDYQEVPPKSLVEEFIKGKDEIDRNIFDKISKKNPEIIGISEADKAFHQRLIEFFLEKKVHLELEDLDADIFYKWIIRWVEMTKVQENFNLGAIKNRTTPKKIAEEEPDFFLNECNSRDEQLVNKIRNLSLIFPKKHFLIVRGYLHKNFSNLLSKSGFLVKDYSY